MPKPIRSRQHAALITLHDLCDDFIARCHANNLSARTIEWYEMRIRRFMRWCEVVEISRLSSREGSVSPKSPSRHLIVGRAHRIACRILHQSYGISGRPRCSLRLLRPGLLDQIDDGPRSLEVCRYLPRAHNRGFVLDTVTSTAHPVEPSDDVGKPAIFECCSGVSNHCGVGPPPVGG